MRHCFYPQLHFSSITKFSIVGKVLSDLFFKIAKPCLVCPLRLHNIIPATIEAYDGKFVVHGGLTEILKGNWNPERIVILEFPTVDRAKEWWGSEAYAKAKEIRHKAAKTGMIVIPEI